MKKRLIFCIPLSATLLVGLFSAISLNSKKDAVVEGYSTSSLPTTIDLNDTSEANIRSYYSSLNSLATSQRQGTNLLKNLKTILKNGQKYYSYDSGNAIWQIYEIADRDWSKSPASSTTYGTYNSGTNKITNYTYGTSASSSKNNPYIHALYINRNVTNQTTAWDDHQQTQWGINREHVWPKAEGFETSGAGGARGDPMHLIAGNGYANNIHSNYYYGYVNPSSIETNCGSKYSNLSGNLMGKSKTLGGSTNVFEPQDSDKGDIARAIFYMVARYNYLSKSDSDGIDSNNPNLVLTQSLSDWASSGYSSTTSTTGKMGIMTDLLAWHHADPVDEYEIHRNNLLYTNYTNNRNPFIDFPEWADFIWGSVNYNGSTYVSHDTTPTGYATPSDDTINGYNGGGSTVAVTGVSLDKATATIGVGGTVALTATVTPSNATNKGITWTSTNTSKATVVDGVVTGKAAGSTTITATTKDGGFTASCTVTVKAVSSLSVSNPTTEFETGDDFVFGGTATVHYSDSTTADVTSSVSFDGYDLSTAGNQTVTVSYGNVSTTYSITVTQSSSATEEGSVTAASGALEGWKASGTGSAYADGAVKFDSGGDNVYKIDIFSGDVSSGMTSLTVTINGKINGSPTAANSYKVEALDSNGNVLASDVKTGSDIVTTSYGDTVFTIDSGLTGCTGIKITYVTKGGGNWGIKSVSWVAEYSTSSEPVLSSIAVKTAPTKLTYHVGDGFDANGLVIRATYSDSSTEDIAYEDNEDLFEFDPADNLQTTDVSVTISYGGKSCSQNITVNSDPSISWNAPVINVYSGSTLSGSDVNGWSVTYNDGAGHQTVLTYSQLTVKLGGITISIPHTWAAGDDGKTLTATYSSLTTTESAAVQVTQTVNTINKETPGSSDTSNLTFTGACGGSGTADDNKTWTVTSDGTESSFDSANGKGIHYGTSSAQVKYIKLTSTDFTSGKITKVEVNASTASGVTATVSVTVGGDAFGGDPQSLTSSAVPDNPYTFTGEADADTIEVLITKPSKATKAIYCKSVVVTYSTSSVTTNIANKTEHIDAQRVAVKFAKAFNAAMDTTNYCTANLSTAWSTCSSAYSTFLSEAAALGSSEEAYAKDLIAYATAQYSDDSGEACIERMLKTYEVCVTKHGQTAFMSELVSLSKPHFYSPLKVVRNNAIITTIIVAVSIASIASIGAYFVFRKKKEDK